MTQVLNEAAARFFDESEQVRKPRIALMGEFSAGKSTLANLMIGTNPLPVQVVATQLPPVWIVHGDDACVIVDLEGHETTCDLKAVQDIVPEDIAFIKFYCREQILEMCDIIDMPGISDPNMPSAVWERIIPFADGVIWCSPATQAWRQSEAAVWDSIDESIRKNSVLLLTRADMLVTAKDRLKVEKRVKAEVSDQFAHVQMMSLIDARDGEDDVDAWDRSGADTFVSEFLDIVQRISSDLPSVEPVLSSGNDATMEQHNHCADANKVTPRRPTSRKSSRHEQAPESSEPEISAALIPKFS